ncbi:hypothetical protein CXG81DRAFT_12397 [Caulochytrium protostelioides]|uniref:ATP phosphoribosyltransferase n=1 Tax=Caulochytrium protostelioides TaxID=1555241 RepID=A0A4P9X7A4_9FUNG|nr:hypothetical protein CXG81DRAFT_12397 [Caulochytrium protostelioides]|eukprot:RKP01103.1 hypothetical protein CXG81DRAFT_12397 [Caulochytrium protostelioides]
MEISELDGERLLFAVPKKGRLHQRCLQLLEGADIQFHRKNRLDIATSTNLPLTLVFLPAADIAKFVGNGNVDLGITGEDMIAEVAGGSAHGKITTVQELGFGTCRLSLQAPAADVERRRARKAAAGAAGADAAVTPRDFVGCRVATSFVHLATKYFGAMEAGATAPAAAPPAATGAGSTRIEYVGGSVEAACGLGLADAVVDLVESGETMRAAGLVEVGTLMATQAVLVANRAKLASDGPRRALVDMIVRRIRGVLAAARYVLINYNMRRDQLAEARRITPGRKAPTVSTLEDPEWIAVSAMILKKDAATIMDQLEAVGARDILVFEIHNCRE